MERIRSHLVLPVLMGVGSGLVLGASGRLVIELTPQVVGQFFRGTPEGELQFEAAVFLLIALALTVVATVIGWRLGRQFAPDIRAFLGAKEPPTDHRSRSGSILLMLATAAIVAIISVAVISAPIPAVVALALGVAIRLAVLVGLALAHGSD